MHHPWRAFSYLTEWTLIVGGLPDGLMGLTCWRTRTVRLHADLLQVERRCTIAHEMQHIARGRPPTEPVLAAREEAAVEQEAARLLIDLQPLGEALAWSSNLAEVADELWVDADTLRIRLDHLHPAERHYLRRRLDDQG